MTGTPTPASLAEAREQFLALVDGLRPELHRYCARLTGSVIEGEDIVQDTLAKAFYALSLSPDVPPLEIDPTLMEQVFINVLTNAAQASAADAPITVATRAVRDEAEIGVADRGCGIPRDRIETIFNPFVTNKQNGVGLGLAIVAKIIDGHGGRMAVESEPGKGSTFRIYLPIPKSIPK